MTCRIVVVSVLPRGSPLTPSLSVAPPCRVADPSEAQVDQLHAAYVAALRHLWNDTNAKYGKGVQRGLTIVQ